MPYERELPGYLTTMTDLLGAWILFCILLGGLFLASFV